MTITNVFVYGLFMDRALLTEMGFHPEVIGPAVLADYRIHIGARATLVPSAASRVYGIVMRLSESEAHALYAAPDVSAYQPEEVQSTLLASEEVVEARCYNLPRELGLAGANPGYAARLARLVDELGFDATYVGEIAAFSE